MSTTYVYIASADAFSQPVKVGISTDPSRRARRLSTAWIGSKPLRPIHTVRCANRDTALAVERSALRRLALSGVKTRQELAWCNPSVALGHVQAAWQDINVLTFDELQYDLFEAA